MQFVRYFVKMNPITTKSKTYWQEQREYFKTKTLAFKELKRKRELEIMLNEINKNKNK